MAELAAYNTSSTPSSRARPRPDFLKPRDSVYDRWLAHKLETERKEDEERRKTMGLPPEPPLRPPPCSSWVRATDPGDKSIARQRVSEPNDFVCGEHLLKKVLRLKDRSGAEMEVQLVLSGPYMSRTGHGRCALGAALPPRHAERCGRWLGGSSHVRRGAERRSAQTCLSQSNARAAECCALVWAPALELGPLVVRLSDPLAVTPT